MEMKGFRVEDDHTEIAALPLSLQLFESIACKIYCGSTTKESKKISIFQSNSEFSKLHKLLRL